MTANVPRWFRDYLRSVFEPVDDAVIFFEVTYFVQGYAIYNNDVLSPKGEGGGGREDY